MRFTVYALVTACFLSGTPVSAQQAVPKKDELLVLLLLRIQKAFQFDQTYRAKYVWTYDLLDTGGTRTESERRHLDSDRKALDQTIVDRRVPEENRKYAANQKARLDKMEADGVLARYKLLVEVMNDQRAKQCRVSAVDVELWQHLGGNVASRATVYSATQGKWSALTAAEKTLHKNTAPPLLFPITDLMVPSFYLGAHYKLLADQIGLDYQVSRKDIPANLLDMAELSSTPDSITLSIFGRADGGHRFLMERLHISRTDGYPITETERFDPAGQLVDYRSMGDFVVFEPIGLSLPRRFQMERRTGGGSRRMRSMLELQEFSTDLGADQSWRVAPEPPPGTSVHDFANVQPSR